MNIRPITRPSRPLACLWLVPLAASLGLLACSGEDTDSDGSEPFEPVGTNAAGLCERGTLESDFAAAPLAGVGVDADGLRAGSYVVSSTYLQLRPDARQTFEQLMQPVLADLETRDGLLALSLGQSETCGALRTLAVWRDDVTMLAFVTSPAHAAAMAGVGEVSRGGSVVTHWLGDETRASWAVAAQQLRDVEGPLY